MALSLNASKSTTAPKVSALQRHRTRGRHVEGRLENLVLCAMWWRAHGSNITPINRTEIIAASHGGRHNGRGAIGELSAPSAIHDAMWGCPPVSRSLFVWGIYPIWMLPGPGPRSWGTPPPATKHTSLSLLAAHVPGAHAMPSLANHEGYRFMSSSSR